MKLFSSQDVKQHSEAPKLCQRAHGRETGDGGARNRTYSGEGAEQGGHQQGAQNTHTHKKQNLVFGHERL